MRIINIFADLGVPSQGNFLQFNMNTQKTFKNPMKMSSPQK